jgi:transposase
MPRKDNQASPKPRVIEPQRRQAVMRFEVPEDTLPETHRARLLWSVVATLDLSRFLAGTGSVEGRAGRPNISPAVKLTLWLYAISQGVGSAREIERRIQTDAAYRWILGDLSITHHALSAFRVGHGEALNALMTDILAALMHKGALSLDLVAQDGMRVRAAASAPSFRTYGSLLECREQAALHLKAVLAEADDPEATRGEKAAREAAALDFKSRVDAAIETVKQLQATRSPSETTPRASTTDAEARVMKMPDGGFRPAYNVQFATAGDPEGGPRTVVGVQVTNVGSDMGSITPMLDDIGARSGHLPKTLLADANHGKHECIRNAASRGVEVVIAPPKNAKPLVPRADAADPVVQWRLRMASEAGQKRYRARASLCELTNAHQRSRHGLTQFLVRGLPKVTCVVLLGAVAANILQHLATLLS